MSKPLIQTTGRRKEAVARVRLRPGTGKIKAVVTATIGNLDAGVKVPRRCRTGRKLGRARTVLTPDSDTNIKDGTDPAAPDYIGKHAGTAFMEMQFYPPGWVSWPAGISCDATKWCAALNIDSLS